MDAKKLKGLLEQVESGHMTTEEAMEIVEEELAELYEARVESRALAGNIDNWASEEAYWEQHGLGEHDFPTRYNDAGEPIGYM